MAIGNLGDKVSNSAKEAVNKAKNKPEFEAGFENDSFDDSIFDNIFDDLGDFGSNSTSNNASAAGGTGTDANATANGGINGANSLTNMGTGATMNGVNGNGLNINNGQQQPNQPPKKDAFDIVAEGAGKGGMAAWKVLVDMFKGINTRNYDDWADFGSALTKTGLAVSGGGLIFGVLLSLLGLGGLGIGGAGLSFIITGIITTLSGVVTLTASYYIVTKDGYVGDLKTVPDVDSSDAFKGIGGESQLETDKYGSLFDELMSSGEDDFDFDDDFEETSDFDDYEEYIEEPKKEEEPPKDVSYTDLMDGVQENVMLMNRKFLFETFKPFFTKNTPGFSKREELFSGEAEYDSIEVLTRQAFASACKTNLADMEITIESMESSHFCYILKVQRIKGLNKTEDIKREMEIYFRDDAKDLSVNADVVIERDYYKITITKGAQDVITMGDCFEMQEVCDFYLDESNKMPFIVGVDDYGVPIKADGKKYTTMLIAGKQRSGKSWLTLSLLISWMAFNSPELVQFLIIDPKMSSLFKTMSYMPHVCGLHNEVNILKIFKDIIEKEGKRRKKLFSDNNVDDIWELRSRKGIMLPILYIVIDEFMSVLDTLSKQGQDKEFISTMNVVITQLPSQGIFLVFVPHRAQGVVDKTTRELMTFSAAIRATIDVVKETLGVKWDRPLPNPGDIAVNIDGDAKYVKGLAVAYDKMEKGGDAKNKELIENIAKTFYKMGVDIPDMRSIGSGYNRDDEKIKEVLCIGKANTHKVQYNAHNVFDNLDEELGVGSGDEPEPD